MEHTTNSLTPTQKLLCFKFLGAGFATVALAGSGCGTGILFGSFIASLAYNEEAEARITQPLLLGFALTEAVGLVALCMAFLILFF